VQGTQLQPYVIVRVWISSAGLQTRARVTNALEFGRRQSSAAAKSAWCIGNHAAIMR
jgi:hypothetical protein